MAPHHVYMQLQDRGMAEGAVAWSACLSVLLPGAEPPTGAVGSWV